MYVPFATGNNWSDEIADVTGRADYQTTRITISEPGEMVTDPKTGQDTGTAGTTVYTGQARIIGVRWGTFVQGEAQENSDSLKSVRIQVPKDSLPRVLMGLQVQIVEAPKNPALVGRRLKINNDFQGGSSATRTFECESSAD